MRISNTARSDSRVNFQVQNIANSDNELSFGVEETKPSSNQNVAPATNPGGASVRNRIRNLKQLGLFEEVIKLESEWRSLLGTTSANLYLK